MRRPTTPSTTTGDFARSRLAIFATSVVLHHRRGGQVAGEHRPQGFLELAGPSQRAAGLPKPDKGFGLFLGQVTGFFSGAQRASLYLLAMVLSG